jgi:hypothetical protein
MLEPEAVDAGVHVAHWGPGHSIGLGASVILIAAFGLNPYDWGIVTWLLILGVSIGLVVIVGLGVAGRPLGILIDNRNMISLSRLQIVAWTLLILSAFVTAALSNVSRGLFGLVDPLPDPLGIEIPQVIWALMGISTTSLVGSPLIKNLKASREVPADDPEEKKTLQTLSRRHAKRKGPKSAGPSLKGHEVVNAEPSDASLANLFQGEEKGNGADVDLGKLQMFYFTVVVLLAYGVSLAAIFNAGLGRITEFPDLNPSMVALLGISHAGYLGYKAVPHSTSAPA